MYGVVKEDVYGIEEGMSDERGDYLLLVTYNLLLITCMVSKRERVMSEYRRTKMS